MADAGILTVSAALGRAVRERVDEPAATRGRAIVVLAAYLDLLSQDLGLSDASDDDVLSRATGPREFLSFVEHFFWGEDQAVTAEALRNHVYEALIGYGASGRDMKTAQIYWAISHDPERRQRLPLLGSASTIGLDKFGEPTGLRLHIQLDDVRQDLATLSRLDRANILSGHRHTSGSALLRKGAEIAVRIAEHLVARSLAGAPSLNADYTIKADEMGPLITSIEVAPRGSDWGHEALNVLEDQAQKARANGDLGLVAILRGALSDAAQQVSFANPDDDEPRIALATLLAGLADLEKGDATKALEHLDSSERVLLTLSALGPAEASVDTLAAMTRLGLGIARFQLGHEDTARELVDEAVEAFQHLSDADADLEQLYAVALMFKATTAGDQPAPAAVAALERAATISARLARSTRSPESRLFAAGVLSVQAQGLVERDRYAEAEDLLARASEFLDLLPNERVDHQARLIRSMVDFLRGSVYVFTGRAHEAETILLECAAAAEALPQRGTGGDELMLARVLFMLGASHAGTGRLDDARSAMKRVLGLVQDSDSPAARQLSAEVTQVLAHLET